MESTKAIKKKYRGDLFRHLDGIVTAPCAYILFSKGVTDYLLKAKRASLKQITKEFKANEGYLNVALRALACQGWLSLEQDNKEGEVYYATNGNSEQAFSLFPHYQQVYDLMVFSGSFHPRKFDIAPFKKMQAIAEWLFAEQEKLAASKEENKILSQILKHIEGYIVGPSTVLLGMNGMFHKYFMEASFSPEEFHSMGQSFNHLLDIYVSLGWFDKKNDNYSFTGKGLFFAKRASAYGVTVSYIPMLRKIEELVFGNANILWQGTGEHEQHVDRAMNVWGSGGAHTTYFKKIDEIVIDIFNKDIEQQPKGILDMGCGDGTFLKHLFEVIANRTKRGELLDEHPLFLVGADYNKKALDITKENLIRSEVWAKVIWGDIGNPKELDANLKEDYNLDLGSLLNVRTFLDHNRPWNAPTSSSDQISQSKGAFANRGEWISNNDAELSLKEHLMKWQPYIKKHGLLLIELHTIDPAHTAANLGRTAATAYDVTHGLSDQYIIELDTFRAVAAQLNLHLHQGHAHRFPDSELATVSINYLSSI